MTHDAHAHDSPSAGPHRRFVGDPGRIKILVEEMRAGRLSSEALVTRCLDRIADVEPHVQAWRVVDSDRVLEDARALDREAAEGRFRGPLHGLPVAIKDVMDVEGLPTRCNSRALRDRAPATADAEVVTALRAAGAVVLGKAHTTEYAFFDPSPARNPHDTDHTPGGSSSGSAAAVACGAAPAATGTQTVASVNRPAAYCGIAAFKPSTGLLSTYGVTPLAPMFDTVGFFGYRVADAAALFEAVCPAHAAARRSRAGETDGEAGAVGERLTVVALDDPFLAQSVPAVHDAMACAADRLREAGHEVLAREACISFETLCEEQRRCMLYQTGRVHRNLLDLPRDQVGEKLREAVETGAGIGDGEFRTLCGSLTSARHRLFESVSDAHAVLWPAAPDTAPPGLAWTGDPRYIAPWTALGGPVVTVNVRADGAGLPIGALLAGAPGTDADFTGIARRLAEALEV
ncbi:MAG: amidase [Gammaproteobacteria bacterium]|nr:amidase [Gammaproteobacteria bacterium]